MKKLLITLLCLGCSNTVAFPNGQDVSGHDTYQVYCNTPNQCFSKAQKVCRFGYSTMVLKNSDDGWHKFGAMVVCY